MKILETSTFLFINSWALKSLVANVFYINLFTLKLAPELIPDFNTRGFNS